MSEQRKVRRGENPRVPVQRPIALRFNYFSQFTEELLVDISAGGMFIRTRRSHPVASVFEFEVRLEDDLEPIRGKAQVVWLRGRGKAGETGMGARFVELDGEDQRLIQRLVDDYWSGAGHRPAEAEPSGQEQRETLIQQHLKTLRLPAFAHRYEARARQARAEGWDYEDFLRELLEDEIVSRRKSTAKRRLRAAQFPAHKTLEQTDWKALAGAERLQLEELASCHYIEQAENVVFVGPVGSGKTHLAIALGIEAAQRRYRVLFRRATDLVRELIEARDERELGRLQRRLERVDLLICDELGPVRLDQASSELLFQALSGRCEQRSTIVTSTLAPNEWARALGDEALASALRNRLARGARLFELEGSSYRPAGEDGEVR